MNEYIMIKTYYKILIKILLKKNIHTNKKKFKPPHNRIVHVYKHLIKKI